MSPKEHMNSGSAHSVFSYFSNMAKMALLKNHFLLRSDLVAAVAGNGLCTQMAEPHRLIQLSQIYRHDLF